MNFYYCETCGNLVIKLEDSGNNLVCCGLDMQLLEAQTVESGIGEKHVPVCKMDGCILDIKVGSTLHPSLPEHFIKWIYVETKNGGIIRQLTPTDSPEICVKLSKDDTPLRVYIYCNLHGLWKCECGGLRTAQFNYCPECGRPLVTVC